MDFGHAQFFQEVVHILLIPRLTILATDWSSEEQTVVKAVNTRSLAIGIVIRRVLQITDLTSVFAIHQGAVLNGFTGRSTDSIPVVSVQITSLAIIDSIIEIAPFDFRRRVSRHLGAFPIVGQIIA